MNWVSCRDEILSAVPKGHSAEMDYNFSLEEGDYGCWQQSFNHLGKMKYQTVDIKHVRGRKKKKRHKAAL